MESAPSDSSSSSAFFSSSSSSSSSEHSVAPSINQGIAIGPAENELQSTHLAPITQDSTPKVLLSIALRTPGLSLTVSKGNGNNPPHDSMELPSILPDADTHNSMSSAESNNYRVPAPFNDQHVNNISQDSPAAESSSDNPISQDSPAAGSSSDNNWCSVFCKGAALMFTLLGCYHLYNNFKSDTSNKAEELEGSKKNKIAPNLSLIENFRANTIGQTVSDSDIIPDGRKDDTPLAGEGGSVVTV